MRKALFLTLLAMALIGGATAITFVETRPAVACGNPNC